MNKKILLIGAIVILLVLIVGFVHYPNFNQNEQIKIDNVIFNMPAGYNETTSNISGEINITNGFNSMQISKCNESNIKDIVNEYKTYKEKNNYSVSLSNFTIDDKEVYKVDVTNDTTIHYWFTYNGKLYSIYTWDGNDNNDNIVSEFVKSARTL